MEPLTGPGRPAPPGGAEKGTATRRRSARRTVLRTGFMLAAALTGVCALAFAGGFASFITRIAYVEPRAVRPADGIVVLTGGASRVSDGIQLLAQGQGRRLLISGVNRSTTAEELRRTLPADEALLDCCVDLGRKALNTWGNAIEVAEWTRDKGFRTLLVVTSTWHMPRALFELERIMPGVELISYPVVTDRMLDAQWWREPETAKLLLKEYVKYLLAQAKIRPLQAVAPPGEPSDGKSPSTSPNGTTRGPLAGDPVPHAASTH